MSITNKSRLLLVLLPFLLLTACGDPFGLMEEDENDTVQPALKSASISGEQGDIVPIELSAGTAESLGVQIGEAVQNNYELRAELEPGGDSDLTLYFDTTAAGDSYETIWTGGDSTVTSNNETSLSSLLEAGNYEISVRVPDHAGSVVDRGTLQLAQGTVEQAELLLSPQIAVVDQGETAEIPLSVGDVDSIWIKIGSEDVGYELEVRIRPRLDSEVRLRFDTGAAGSTATTLTTSQDADITQLSETDLGGSQLAAELYPISFRVPDENGREFAVGTLDVRVAE